LNRPIPEITTEITRPYIKKQQQEHNLNLWQHPNIILAVAFYFLK